MFLIGPLAPLSLFSAPATVRCVVANLFAVYKGLNAGIKSSFINVPCQGDMLLALHKAYYPVVEGYALLKCDRYTAAPMTD